MFNRHRQMRISLAAKCQLLFGAAVVLIITAALFVPWQRMDQLTEQINERAARMLCDDAIGDHLSGIPVNVRPTSLPVRSTTRASTRDARDPAALELSQAVEGRAITAPHLALLATAPPESLTAFERRALKQFTDHPDSDVYAKTLTPADALYPEYHYARALRADAGCVRCHDSAGRISVTPINRGDGTPSTNAATAPALSSAVVGLVSINMRSQVDTNQLLLNRIFLLAAGLLAGTLALVVFYIITTRLILQPVRVLQETAEKVSKGDLNIRSHLSTGDEFETLSRTLNTMLGNLKESQDQLKAINKGLDLKLNQLAESNVALYESNRLKSEFLANVSHELRTPLNSILGFAELLRDMNAGEGRQIRYLQNILMSGRNLLELINDLLDLAKIEAGRMEIRSEPLSVNDLFEGLISILKPLAEKGALTIVASVALDVPILHTDGAKLQQVLYNFLSNAIKFSPAEGKIELTAERDGDDAVRISVADQGPGIHPEQQQVIFEKFRQIDGSVTREHGGTGLGLAISKELVLLLGGAMGVTSVVGSGATFWVRLPFRITASQHDVRRAMVLN
jgi:two-component system sensor histidine kinase BarA